MARHRAPRCTGVIAGGVVAAGTGLALLLVPAAPIAARTGSVLTEPPVTGSVLTEQPAGSTREGTGPATAPSEARPTGAPPPVNAPTVTAPTVTAGSDVVRPVPLPVLRGFVPDRLVVEALGVDAPLVTTLVDATGAFVPPEDPAELGWWRGVRPGTGSGSVLVAGHIDSSRYGQGPLARLVDLVPGDRAVLSGPDGGRVEYAVRGVETFRKEALPAGDLFRRDGAERLVLVTCGGSFDRAGGTWDSNIVAVLDRVPPG